MSFVVLYLLYRILLKPSGCKAGSCATRPKMDKAMSTRKFWQRACHKGYYKVLYEGYFSGLLE